MEGSYVTSLYPVKAKTVKTQETLISYCNHLRRFLRTKYNLSDISFQALDYSFVEAFDFYLRVQLKFKPNTIVGIWGNSKGSELLATPCPYREQSPSQVRRL
ncbi:phage integrase SAM-like domain-containing protein [Bacteroides fragilis]|uniref:phage integrase SAM-like domain-containing protein n=1 Tax=Bacteroides fragilis TaxID=817 RepID=UPI0024550870|nr:phage integrase SAM-like domain-containing protein [Bacteroides fragilis]